MNYPLNPITPQMPAPRQFNKNRAYGTAFRPFPELIEISRWT